MNVRALILSLIVALGAALPPARAAVAIRFDQTEYEVVAGSELVVGIVIDADDQKPDLQALPAGLFSFGVRLTYPTVSLATDRGGIDVVPELDYTGLVPGVTLELGTGFVMVKGNIALTSGGGAYAGTRLFTVRFRNLPAATTRLSLTLGSARAQASESLVVDGRGVALDEGIVFGRASGTVVPRPPSPPPRLELKPLPSGALELTFPVGKGVDHFVETSEDLRRWSDLFAAPRNDGRVLLKPGEAAGFFRLRTSDVRASEP